MLALLPSVGSRPGCRRRPGAREEGQEAVDVDRRAAADLARQGQGLGIGARAVDVNRPFKRGRSSSPAVRSSREGESGRRGWMPRSMKNRVRVGQTVEVAMSRLQC